MHLRHIFIVNNEYVVILWMPVKEAEAFVRHRFLANVLFLPCRAGPWACKSKVQTPNFTSDGDVKSHFTDF